ncbi:MAG TPA: amidase [Candidatus Binataceae bacterium]|jgi:aspartyl-tRNA(Asn)/glutamyl-tRNA(Gln) amidotransferase subunit A|nr:amidase [Candidatus Binataceae bacterium]
MTSSDELTGLDVVALADRIRRRELSPVELTESFLRRIERLDSRLKCYITVTADQAREAARRAEAEIAGGAYRGPWHGIPIALKDLCAVRGVRNTGGSKILADQIAAADCTVWARLQAAGAVLLGKLNLHEFAAGLTNTNQHWGTCRNPYNLERIPGGSSGGSAAAVVAGLAAATIGTDTGGSIRIPAAFCGCVGIKPTYSRVSRYGILPLADSLDHAGPITRSVRDAALMLNAIAGYDASDSTSSREPVPDYLAACDGGLAATRVGVIKELTTGLSADVAVSFNRALDHLRSRGAALTEVSIPSIAHIAAISTTITFVEAAEYHERWLRERPDDYSVDVRRAFEAGMLMPALHYVRAQRARAVMVAEALAALDRNQVLVAPTAAIPAPLIDRGARTLMPNGEPVDVVASVLRFTAPFNVTGQPALAIPTGLSADGLPLSMQIIGRPFDEAAVFRIAAAYEETRGPLPAPTALAA